MYVAYNTGYRVYSNPNPKPNIQHAPTKDVVVLGVNILIVPCLFNLGGVWVTSRV
jgi:hypothetical protein